MLIFIFLMTGEMGDSLRQGIAGDLTVSLYRQYMPMVFFGPMKSDWQLLPIMEYAMGRSGGIRPQEVAGTSKIEIPSEWEEAGEASLEEDAAYMEQLLRQENLAAMERGADKKKKGLSEAEELMEEGISMEEGTFTEENISGTSMSVGTFTPHEKQVELNWESLKSYEELLKQFYTIDANTMAGSDQLDAQLLSQKDLRIDKQAAGPQILIYHTHSQESFADSVPGDSSTSIVGVGEQLTRILTEQYGYQVLHHMGQFDVKTRDDAYSNALPVIQELLLENPSIQVVIDLHRDEMPEETRLVTDVDGRPTARFMFFNGLSRTRKTGSLDYLRNENQEDNLAFSFQMKQKAEEYYPGLTRKIYLKGYRYNLHLCPRSLLIELGAQNNTVEEAMNACDPLAHILDMVLSGT
ncbi:MAG: stage II sporulation protein P [Roseburia sp.]|nr:stage II sporulation protein P [Roseburia sp.]